MLVKDEGYPAPTAVMAQCDLRMDLIIIPHAVLSTNGSNIKKICACKLPVRTAELSRVGRWRTVPVNPSVFNCPKLCLCLKSACTL